ncbi:hypothetical protein K491DRAFT_776032 [Lophiostoma macrostomum CBS 122681]|uniref:Microbial-type PARG catalytic domain-containing protein n=1 Tax=Lophiostoma macrostomum CBS 122681 TaxID=1314788 RepID=A0A6A6TGA4_9PLEO|nr:hypothetical protein K491DRAFT_776032 [Lophiostoma macrostomum CBS 122681]
MGRTEKSKGLAPPAVRKDVRAKQARHIVNKVIPATLASNARARRGAEGSELIIDPPQVNQASVADQARKEKDVQYVKRKGQGRRKAKGEDEEVIADTGRKSTKNNNKRGKKRSDSLDQRFETLDISSALSRDEEPKVRRRIRVIATDTLTAANILASPSSSKKKEPNTCILNMASSLRPGGGVLSGATSQEEFLCSRTTLLPSLQESFYRLPEVGGIFTHDVLVFRDAGPLGNAKGEIAPGDRYWVDVISAGMLRFPELEGDDDEVKRLGKKDRELVEAKMRAVLRMAQAKGVRKLVLGAWGCGAYGNPVGDVARSWRTVLEGDGRKKGQLPGDADTWNGLEEVVFAISNRRMADKFGSTFNVDIETGPGSDADEDNDDEGQDQVAEELRTKIQEMEGQIAQVWNADLKARMHIILQGLREQLKEREAMVEEDGVEGGDDGSGSDERVADQENHDHEMIAGSSDGDTNEDEVRDYDDALDSEDDGGLRLPR